MSEIKSIQPIVEQLMKRPGFEAQYRQSVAYIVNHPHVQSFLQANKEHINTTIVEASMAKLNEFVREMDAFAAGKKGKNPGYAPVLFINDQLIDIAYKETAQSIQARQARQKQALVSNRTMSRDVRQATMADVLLDTPSRKDLMREITQFMVKYLQDPYKVPGLFIAGPYGVGKTFMLGALANELAQKGIEVTMIHYPTFVLEVKDAIAENLTRKLIDQVKKAPLLIIDDIGAEVNSSWVRDEVLGVILEYRMKESLATFFTSNFSMDDLYYHLQETKNATENIKAARLMERIRYLSKEVRLEGENLRRKNRGE